MSIRVLIADDHPTFRAGLRAVLDGASDLQVIGEACNGFEAIEQATTLRPNVILLDLAMPGLDGIEACQQIVKAGSVRVVMLTMSGQDDAVLGAFRAGATGYLLKDAPPEQIVAGVRAASAGNALLSTGVAERLPVYFASRAEPAIAFPDLTRRELEVLELLAQGEGDPAIGRKLSLSRKTVRNYVSSILAKMPARDRAHAVARARDEGFGTRRDS